MRAARLLRLAARGQGGQAMVEAALTLPLLCAFLFTMIELCLCYYSYCMISESARQGTRYAIVRGATCETASKASCTVADSDVNTYVTSLGWPNLGGGTETASTTFPDGNKNPGSRVQVTVSYSFPIDLPFVPQSTLALQSSSTMYFIQ
ncbi:MAG TPA: TadE/TadG family type IV pilus assembly protein [Terracidiphilus sp.]|nr:TadE/TadG family type IV pilus assembly protein [Terracidiphilus sp.]